MRLNDKQKFIAVGAFFVVAIGGVSTLNFLQWQSRSDLLAQTGKLQKRESAAQEKIKRIPRLLEQRAELIANIEKYAEILPAERHVQHDQFVEIIDSYRRDTDIIITKADYIPIDDKKSGGKKRKNESFVRHRYRFSLLASVPDFVEFVNKIENHTRFLKVDAFKIRPFAGEGSGGGSTPEEKELHAASQSQKEIELTLSTYTYRGGSTEAEQAKGAKKK